MAKPVDKKQNKYKKMKNKYKAVIQSLLEERDKLNLKIKEMEIYYLSKIKCYNELMNAKISDLKNDNEEINLKYLSVLKEMYYK